jgi:hypothetical protein
MSAGSRARSDVVRGASRGVLLLFVVAVVKIGVDANTASRGEVSGQRARAGSRVCASSLPSPLADAKM